MSYAIDKRLLRLAGDLLANGSGTFTADNARRLFRGVLEDQVIAPREMAALLVVRTAVVPRADAEARRLFDGVVSGVSQDDPALEPWIASHLSLRVLRQAAALISGRGPRHRVSRADVLALMSDAYRQGGTTPGLSPDEGLAFLVVRELLRSRAAADAQNLLDELCASVVQDGVTLGDAGTRGTDHGPGPGGQQCGACYGAGAVTCSACGGSGHHVRGRTRTRYDGSTEYYQEHVPCTCTNGRLSCRRCGGSGRL